MINVICHGKPNMERFGRTWLEILAREQGMEIIPETVKVILKERKEEDQTCE